MWPSHNEPELKRATDPIRWARRTPPRPIASIRPRTAPRAQEATPAREPRALPQVARAPPVVQVQEQRPAEPLAEERPEAQAEVPPDDSRRDPSKDSRSLGGCLSTPIA